ncbi:hypothetical protein [Halorubrum laminariae]|uniref:Cox cluster protein n=1 Tax=Halorubrum laminariae TaxID=1433523 RepID=A0ABD6C599_9EURY|nr:hypothetical protein [Halorubrum laminariae]
MAHPRLDTEQLSPDFDGDDDDSDDEDGFLDRFDFDATHWQVLRQLLLPTPTFVTLVVYGFLWFSGVTMAAFLGFVVHPVFEMVALAGFVLMYPAGFLGLVVVIAVKAIQ